MNSNEINNKIININTKELSEVGNKTQSYTTIVTCYFKIPSKHPIENYKKWMTNMLENINTCMYIFCDLDTYEFIKEKRKGRLDRIFIKIIELTDFYTHKYLENYKNHHKLDPEQIAHNPFLYMIWAEKSNFMKLAGEENIFNSEFFFWCDIGCFRNRENKRDIPLDKILNFPNEQKIKSIPRDKIVFTQTGPFPKECNKMLPIGLTAMEFTYVKASIGGTMFGCYKENLNGWHKIFYENLELFFKYNRFAGKDQNIYANICVQYPNLVLLFQPTYGDEWFFFHWLFS